MPIPDFQTIMLPLMDLMSDGKEHAVKDLFTDLSNFFTLTEEEKKKLLPSGSTGVFKNRLAWSVAHLKMAGLLESPQRSIYRITQLGKESLKSKPAKIGIKFLEQYPGYLEARLGDGKKESKMDSQGDETEYNLQTPDELMDLGYQKIRKGLANELFIKIKSQSPSFFESLVIDLLIKMGYGGSNIDQGEVLGRSGDEGIDGIIKEDKLGLDVIYIQAKRWDSPVGRPEIQKFVGALQGKRAKKGIFITTSKFSNDAYQFAQNIESRIVLMDGEYLANLMIDNGVGVTTKNTYEIKKIDSDYFIEE